MRAPPRNWGLTIRMVVLAVLTPAVGVGVIIALLFVFVHHSPWLALGVICGLGVAVTHLCKAPDGRLLYAAEDPELFGLVNRLSALANIKPPQLLESDQDQPNSWVVHLPGQPAHLYLTRGLRNLLTVDELQAVIAHEVAHIAHRDSLVMSVVGLPSSALMEAPGAASVPCMLAGFIPLGGTMALSRYRELAADADAAVLTGRPSALAMALLKVSGSLKNIPSADLREAAALNAVNLMPVEPPPRWWYGPLAARVFASHPSLQARLEQLHALEAAQQRPVL